MTFLDLLEMMRASKPVLFRNQPEEEGLDDSDELIFRLRCEVVDMNREWSNTDLIAILQSNGKNMNKEIPCRHCGSHKTEWR